MSIRETNGLASTGNVPINAGDTITEAELKAVLVWDDDEDPDALLALGSYTTCGGQWNSNRDGTWTWCAFAPPRE